MKPSDHEMLHDWTARAALAGAAVSVLELLVRGRLAGAQPGLFEALRIAAVVAVVVPPRNLTDGAALLVLALSGGALATLAPPWALPLAAAVVAGALTRGVSGNRRRLEVFGVAAVLALAGLVIRRAFLTTGILEPSFGPGMSALAAGAMAGAVTGLGAIGRLFRPAEVVRVGVSQELEQLATEAMVTDPEVSALLRRAAEAHQQAAEAVEMLAKNGEPATKNATDDLLKRMVGFAREWHSIERRTATTSQETLIERKAVLEARLDKTEDPIARAELGRAIVAVQAQAEAVKEIRLARERVLARMEHQVATLERLRLAALRHQSADAGRIQAELQPVLDELSQAGGDFDIAAEVLDAAHAEPTR